jgi:Fe2+ transport system protein FeoA
MVANNIAPLAVFSEHDGFLEIVQVLGDDAHSRRLCELGFCVGKRVSVVTRGDPAIMNLGGSRFALAGELQERIFARPVKP